MLNLIFFIFVGKTFAAEEWSGTHSGITLTSDVILVGDTYMTSKITIPKNEEVTIDLNGYMLHGSGKGTIIENNGKLIIKDSRPTYRKS